MAEVTAFRNNALPYPVYGVPWTIVFPLLDADGDPVTGATCDSEISKNGDTGADCTNEGTEITFTTATNKGMYYLTLTAAEMTADIVVVTIYSATSKATCIVLYPRKLVLLREGTPVPYSAYGAVRLDVGAPEVDDLYNGCVLAIIFADTHVEVRLISDYNANATRFAAVNIQFTAIPGVDDAFEIYLPEGKQVHEANLVAILGTALTETAGYLAAAFKKFFNIETPVLTVASVNQTIDNPTAAAIGTDAASKVLVTPAQKLVTDADGKVTYSNAAPPTADAIGTDAAGKVTTAHGTGSYLTATGFATPTNVTDAAATAAAAVTTAHGTGSYLSATGFATPGAKMDLVDAPSTTAVASIKTNLGTVPASGNWNTTTPPTAASVADAVWDEVLHTAHETASSASVLLQASGAAADPLLNIVPGSYAEGTAGAALGNIAGEAIKND